ncbi:phosphatidylinositol 3-kinase regulatory subunit gamma-like [Physella acuta]|uniref:phosphatidylinositol 3-kinase regulatory subunit gamma-like n=1 Tax=Physella acuta TaxID=109671 RepID=UPI0027DBEF81|nr:phosphatidylinositol 3-kinase regulatory subunit gamma-like [Physella acuta]
MDDPADGVVFRPKPTPRGLLSALLDSSEDEGDGGVPSRPARSIDKTARDQLSFDSEETLYTNVSAALNGTGVPRTDAKLYESANNSPSKKIAQLEKSNSFGFGNINSPSDHSNGLSDSFNQRLTQKVPPWFWVDLSRSATEEKLKELPDGSFLVRNSSTTVGEFTLTVRQDGQCKSLKILSHGGRYGLRKNECTFDSLTELVEYYSRHTLADFNKNLTTKLVYPVTKPSIRRVHVYDALSHLANLGRCLQKMKIEYALLQKKQFDSNHELMQAQMEAKALDAAKEMFDNFINTSHNSEDEMDELGKLSDDKKNMLKTNSLMAAKKQMMICEQAQKAWNTVKSKDSEQILLLQNLNAYVSDLMDKEEQCACFREQVLECGAKPEVVECILNEDTENISWRQDQWLVSCSREEAINLLTERDVGTFLIRPKDDVQKPYALSIVCSIEDSATEVKHCVIYHPTGRGYGFRADGAVFESLDELVSKHACTSIKIYFSHMDTCLAYPVFEGRQNTETFV